MSTTEIPLGDFSVSLAVKDLAASREFYTKLGFSMMPPEGEDSVWESYNQTWVILRHPSGTIGLFQGMFEDNILTFNPTDVRAVQQKLEDAGLTLLQKAEAAEGPGHCMLQDPDGNVILIDQH